MQGITSDNIILVKYSFWWRKLVLYPLILLSPVVLGLGSYFAIGVTVSLLFLFGLIPCVAVLFFMVCLSDPGFTLDSSGLTVPRYLVPFVGFRKRYLWDEISHIQLIQKEFHGGKVRFQLPHDVDVVLDLDKMALPDQQLFFYALTVHGKQVDRDSQIHLLQDKIGRQTGLGRNGKPLSLEEQLNEDRQLTLKYSRPIRLLLLGLTLFLFPLWGIVGVFGTLALPLVFFSHPHVAPVLLLCPLLFVSGVILSAFFFDTTLTVGEAGISFPLFMMPFLQFRRDRSWKKMKRLRFISRGKKLEKGVLDIYFESGQHTALALNALSDEDLEKLLLTLNIWAQNIEQDVEIKLLQESLSNKKLGIGAASYTKIWEDEMNRRFSSTGFVPLQEGHKLKAGSLRLVKPIAYGGLSAVYLVQENETELLVLKEFVVPDTNEALKSKARELFERESKILMKLSHPRLARVRDCFVEDSRTYLLLDYIPGTDLRQIILQKGKQDEQTVRAWGAQIVEILQYLHAQNPPVVHRDLTPDNVLLTADDQIKLIDFGAANEFVGTATGTLVGKQSFIAPEQFRGDTVPQSDIYSLGATLFYLLTGDEPISLSQSFPKKLDPLLSDEINQLVADCTAFDPADRISSLDLLTTRIRGV